MRKAVQRLKNERGLTLVELLAVIVILAIVAVIAFVFIGGVINNAKKDAHVANATQIIAATKLYEASGGELVGTSNNEMTSTKLIEEEYLETLTDPWTKEKYNTVATVTKKDGIYSISFNASEDCNLSDAEEETLNKEGRDACQ